MMSSRQRDTEFLKQCIRYDDTEERHRLEERITQIQGDERIVRRAVWLMALLAALAMAGLGYSAVFITDYPLNVSQLTTRFIIKALCALGAGSLGCLFVFLGLGVFFRRKLEQRREDCRRLALKVLELRLGQPNKISVPEIVKEQEILLAEIGIPIPPTNHSTIENSCDDLHNSRKVHE
ncbi:MAG: hypothetical protein QOF48_2016 [Verrucomicrobiota bacterium]|jgi:formate hydrogenlyase subunit 3/multisubunit Na+/H+ antiporter MnhD subunit